MENEIRTFRTADTRLDTEIRFGIRKMIRNNSNFVMADTESSFMNREMYQGSMESAEQRG